MNGDKVSNGVGAFRIESTLCTYNLINEDITNREIDFLLGIIMNQWPSCLLILLSIMFFLLIILNNVRSLIIVLHVLTIANCLLNTEYSFVYRID